MQLQNNRSSQALQIPAFFRLGFRPFFLLGALLAFIAIPLWIAGLAGKLGAWQPLGGWLAWHMHEMVFGFGAVIIAGFLLTAVQTWTGVPSISGNRLAALTLLWLAARIAWLLNAPALLVLILDGAFIPLVALQMAYCVGKVKQTRNYPIVVVLSVLAGLNFLSLYGTLSNNFALSRQAAIGAVWAVAALMSLIGGRVIPFFTQKGLSLPQGTLAWPWLDNFLLAASLLIAISYGFALALPASPYFGVVFLAVGLGHAIRFTRWYKNAVWRVSLLWSLYLAYAWLACAFIAMGLWHFGLLQNASTALHALTVGAMAGLILAMIARVTLGHTGRPLVPPTAMAWGFALFNLGAFVRVFAVQFQYMHSLWLASALWAISFGIFLAYYGPMLCKARIDGRPG